MYSHTTATRQLCEGSPAGLVFLGCRHIKKHKSCTEWWRSEEGGGGGGDERESRVS